MVFKNTYSKKSRRAFSLIEMIIGIGLGALLFCAVGALTIYGAKSFSSMINYSELNKGSRMALDFMTKEIRQSEGLASYTTNTLTFNSGGTNNLIYTYDASQKTLTQTKNGVDKLILEDCVDMSWEFFIRTPKAATFDLYPTTVAKDCKLIQLNWVCARDRVSITNSESVQSMRIVIRKKQNS